MKVHARQLQQLGEARLRRKVNTAMVNHAEGFAQLSAEQRSAFMDEALAEARNWGFRSEQGLGAYALALWFLDTDFPASSRYLQALLESTTLEVRKVHAMNEWVSSRLGHPDEPGIADERLRQAYHFTAPWGGQP